MRHEKTGSVIKIILLWEPWKEDETPRKFVLLLLGRNVAMKESLQIFLTFKTNFDGIKVFQSMID